MNVNVNAPVLNCTAKRKVIFVNTLKVIHNSFNRIISLILSITLAYFSARFTRYTIHVWWCKMGLLDKIGATYINGIILFGLIYLTVGFIQITFFVSKGITGTSMFPAINPLANRINAFYFFPQLFAKRFDVVLIYPPFVKEKLYVKRIIGFSGDTIVIKNGVIAVIAPDGKVFAKRTPFTDVSYGPVKVGGKSLVFVLGDNLRESADSRIFGPIPKAFIYGKVTDAYRAIPDEQQNA